MVGYPSDSWAFCLTRHCISLDFHYFTLQIQQVPVMLQTADGCTIKTRGPVAAAQRHGSSHARTTGAVGPVGLDRYQSQVASSLHFYKSIVAADETICSIGEF